MDRLVLLGMLWRLPLAWLAAICVATAGSVFLVLVFSELGSAHPNVLKLLSDMVLNIPLVWPLVIYLGFGAAAALLTPAFLIAYVLRASRRGYVIAGALAGLAYAVADLLHAQAGSKLASAAAKNFWHFFDWMNFIHNSAVRGPEWVMWVVSAMLAGALAGLLFARVTRGLRPPFNAARRDGYG
jgi:hypothetical protein